MIYFVQFLQEGNRFEILAAAKFVGYPLTFLTAVIQIEHRRHRIDAQSIKMKFTQPVERVRDQEVAHFIAAVIEDVSAPIRMLTLARILMFIERGAIESSQRKCVFRKMRGHPVNDHPDTSFVKIIDQETKVVGRPVTG